MSAPILTTWASTTITSSAVNCVVNVGAGECVIVGSVGTGAYDDFLVNSTATIPITSGRTTALGNVIGKMGYMFPDTTGALTVSVTRAVSQNVTLMVSVWAGVNTTTPISTAGISTGDGNAAGQTTFLSTTLNSFSSQVVLGLTGSQDSVNGGITTGVNTVKIVESTAVNIGIFGHLAYRVSGGGTPLLTWNMSTGPSSRWITMAAVLNPTSATTAGGGPSFTVSIWG